MATVENSASIWDDIWDREGIETWRRYPNVFGRIGWIMNHLAGRDESREGFVYPVKDKTFLDVGCGVGVLINQVTKTCGCNAIGLDLSEVAIKTLKEQGFQGNTIDLESPAFELPRADILACTEVVEHLTEPQFHRLLSFTPNYDVCFVSTPNWCLGPEEESQHMRKLSAVGFLSILRQYRPDWRVECIDHYLLGIAGYPRYGCPKGIPTKPVLAKLSFTMPVKNEQDDIERVLKSFRGVADDLVIGIDDKSEDATEEIVGRYADVMFKFTWEDDFSAARNQCMDRCTGEWIFMSEGHEHLHTGVEGLLRLDEVPDFVDVLEVRREGPNTSWYFPWLCRQRPELRYKNKVHNTLVFDDKRQAQASQIATWHERSLNNAIERYYQRKGMNPKELMERIIKSGRKDTNAMFYLANEYKEVRGSFGVNQAIKWFKAFIECSRPNATRYQARISLGQIMFKVAKFLDAKQRETPDPAIAEEQLHKDRQNRQIQITSLLNDAKLTLAQATQDDPSRIEHWLILGEICESVGQLDYAMRFYEYAALGIGRVPASYLFIDKSNYTYLPAQRLVNAYAMLEMYQDALAWAQKIEGLLPPWAPPEAIEETRANVIKLETKFKEMTSGESTEPSERNQASAS